MQFILQISSQNRCFLFSLPTEEVKKRTSHAKTMLTTWREVYKDIRQKIEASGRDQRWEFDRKRLFERTDYMANICQNLYDVAQVWSLTSLHTHLCILFVYDYLPVWLLLSLVTCCLLIQSFIKHHDVQNLFKMYRILRFHPESNEAHEHHMHYDSWQSSRTLFWSHFGKKKSWNIL